MILESRPVDNRHIWRQRWDAHQSELQRVQAFERSAQIVSLTAYQYAAEQMGTAEPTEYGYEY